VQGVRIAETSSKGSPARVTCATPDCAREFSFDAVDTRIFDLPLYLFERRYFYRSELS
jgi:hypothetical protein